MRVAVCHPTIPFMRGGAEVLVDALVDGLRAAGHETELVSVPFKWYPPEEIVHEMAVWRSLDLTESDGVPIDAVIALKFPAYLVRHPRKIVWLMWQFRQAYELWGKPEAGNFAAAEGSERVRDLIFEADRVALREAAAVFAISENVRSRLERSVMLNGTVLYNPSPLSEHLAASPVGPIGDFVLFPSRLDPVKRQRLAVEGISLATTPVRLVLPGAGPDAEPLRQMVAERGLGERVELPGRIPLDALAGRYRESLAVFFAPFDEDYGYVTLEAMAAGRPVIVTTDSGGPLEFVVDGQNGLVVPPEPQAVADAFDRLYRDPGLAARLGAAGRELVRTKVPPWSEVVAALLGSGSELPGAPPAGKQDHGG